MKILNEMNLFKLAIFAIGLMFVACSDSHSEIDGPDESNIEKEGKEDAEDEGPIITEIVRTTPIEISDKEKCIVAAYNQFAWNLLYEIVSGDSEHNHVISPISASWALDMLANGTVGDTQSEILKALYTEQVDLATLNEMNSKVTQNLGNVDSSMIVEISNSIWHSQTLTVENSYVNTLKSAYAAETNTLEYESPEAKVNQWIEDKTHGLVKNLIAQGMITDFALVNTLYLKGSWSAGYKFIANKTTEGSFHNINGDISKAYFMEHKAGYATYATNQYKYVSIPLGAQSFNLNIILPNTSSSVSECIKALTYNDDIPSEVKTVKLKIPKFKIDSKYDFVDALRALGIKKAFNTDADYTSITTSPLNIGTMLQGTNISVGEDGIEGGSATAIMDVASGLSPVGEEEMSVDRPFMFYISECSTGLILMAGQFVAM